MDQYSLIALDAWNVLIKRRKRFPQIYQIELLSRILMHTWVSIDEDFLHKRSLRQIIYLICVQYFMRCKRVNKSQDGCPRDLQLKLFPTRVGGASVLGIAIGVNLLHQRELMEEKHIFRALACLLPGIKVIPGSFYSCLEKKDSSLFCYLEIEKLRGTDITAKDIDLLRRLLPKELKQSIQSLTSSLLYPYNEEETYKRVVVLAQELNSEKDLPQVFISFQAQTQDVLCFNIALVRIRKKNAVFSGEFGSALPSSVQLQLHRIFPLGTVRNKYFKEAVIFNLEADSSLFLRKNWSIDLKQARNYIAKVIEQAFGPFRDYNGGLLSQQNKQLEQIKKHLIGQSEQFYPLMEELFHSFHPPLFQALIPTATAESLFSFLVALVGVELPPEGFTMKKITDGRSMCILIKTDSSECRRNFLEEVKNIRKDTYSSVGWSCLEFERYHYLCFVDLNHALQRNVVAQLTQALKRRDLNREKNKEQKIIRINFQEGDPASLNPQVGIDQVGRCLGKALFEGLTRLNLKGVPEPAAAKEISISPCQRIYTFHLREHWWSNGEEVTAYDFEHTWKKAIAFHSNCLRSDLFYMIKNARDANQGLKPLDEVKIKAVNSRTLVVELEYPAFYFLRLIAQPIFSPLYRGEEEPNHFNGPFLLKEWERDRCLRLTSNPYYWDKKNVQLKGVSISMVKDIRQICELFEKGELDWFGEPFCTLIPGEGAPMLQKRNWKKKKVDQMYWIYLNTRSFPLHSANIRKAFACAINREPIIHSYKGEPCAFSPILLSPSQQPAPWDGNIFLARAFFAEGLKELNLTKEAFPKITLLYGSIPGEEKMVGLIREQLETVLGISVDIVNKEWKQFTYLLDRREYQAAACYRSSPYFYPRSYLELFRESTNFYNVSQWENGKYKELIDQALLSLQTEERERLLQEAESVLLEHMPVIPVFSPDYQYLLGQRLKRVAIASNGDVDLKWILTHAEEESKEYELPLTFLQ